MEPGGPGWSAAEFEDRLRQIGLERYHYRHPFNLRMHDGALSEQEIQTWVRNRYYYQTRIPIKDALIITKASDPQFRREWAKRIHDHEGGEPGGGGLELWLTLADAVGLNRDSVAHLDRVLPDVFRACDAYVEFVKGHDLLESVAASLTEMFAGNIMKVRIAAFEEHYPWVAVEGLQYFQSRTTQAPRDAAWGLAYVIEHATDPSDQQRCAQALTRKCEILWSLLDAIEAAHAKPILSAHADFRTDTVRSDATVVLPERAVELNATGAEILTLCDGQKTTLDIAEQMRARHADNRQAWNDTHEFLGKMRRLGVVENVEQVERDEKNERVERVEGIETIVRDDPQR